DHGGGAAVRLPPGRRRHRGDGLRPARDRAADDHRRLRARLPRDPGRDAADRGGGRARQPRHRSDVRVGQPPDPGRAGLRPGPGGKRMVDSAEELEPVAIPTAAVRGEVWRRLRANPGVIAGLVIVLLYVAAALLASPLAPYDPAEGDVLARLQAPSTQHLLGTDELGRDILSRLAYGARISLTIQSAAVVLALAIGVAWGLVAGYFGGGGG